MSGLVMVSKFTREDAIARLPKDEIFMTQREVAHALGITKTDVINMRRAGKGPADTRLGTLIVYRTNDVELFLEQQFDALREMQEERLRRQSIRASV